MTPSQAEELVRKIAEVTERVFLTHNGIDPVFHFGGGDHGFTTLICPAEYTPATKDAVAIVIRRMLEQDHSTWVMMVSEAWSLEGDSKDEIPTSLENHPDRKEIIIYRLEDVDIPETVAKQMIYRPEGKDPYLGELIMEKQFTSGSEGRMVGLLPRGKMSS